MTLRLHDTLSGETRPLVPLRADRVGIYSCGPTVYGPAHIGNFRSFLFADLLVRHLRWRGYPVTWVMNITDIDDKIIRGAAATGEGDRGPRRPLPRGVPGRCGRPADDAARTSCRGPRQHIDQMVELIATLLERGHAYRTDDGSIFFRIASWPAYGRLARLDPEGLRVGERVEADEYGKDDVRDFALWKGPKPGEPSWETAIGPGRPGWHIECSAMSMAHLGPSFDIHTGGVDLIFPHHEDEIAQSEAATGQPFVGTWLHCAHLRMGGAKMAKSTGNIARVGDLLDAGVSPRALRLALISVHYRAASSHSDESLAAAAAALERLDAPVAALPPTPRTAPDDPTLPGALDGARDGVRCRPRRRPQRLGGPGGALRPRARAQSPDRATPLSTRGCRAGARDPARSRPGARRPARAGRGARPRGSRPAGGPRGGEGRARLGRLGSTPRRARGRAGSPSRTRATASAGAGPRRTRG